MLHHPNLCITNHKKSIEYLSRRLYWILRIFPVFSFLLFFSYYIYTLSNSPSSIRPLVFYLFHFLILILFNCLLTFSFHQQSVTSRKAPALSSWMITLLTFLPHSTDIFCCLFFISFVFFFSLLPHQSVFIYFEFRLIDIFFCPSASSLPSLSDRTAPLNSFISSTFEGICPKKRKASERGTKKLFFDELSIRSSSLSHCRCCCCVLRAQKMWWMIRNFSSLLSLEVLNHLIRFFASLLCCAVSASSHFDFPFPLFSLVQRAAGAERLAEAAAKKRRHYHWNRENSPKSLSIRRVIGGKCSYFSCHHHTNNIEIDWGFQLKSSLISSSGSAIA